MVQGTVSSLTGELEATNQKTETRCTNIRKEVSKALSEQRQQLIAQSEAMSKKMDSVSAKVRLLPVLHLPLSVCVCVCLPACNICLSACLSLFLSLHLSVCLSVFEISLPNLA